mgnify:CR=1 FL=1
MSTFRTLRFSLLVLAMVQLLMSPVAAYAAMSARGSLLLDVCTAAPPVQGMAGDTQPGDQGLSLDPHRCQCLLCAELPLKQAVSLCASITGHGRNELYAQALARRQASEQDET